MYHDVPPPRPTVRSAVIPSAVEVLRTCRFPGVTSSEAETSTPPPRHWEADVLLRDGKTAHIRPIRPEDAELLVEFYSRVSDESKYYRFFSPMPHLSERDVKRFTEVDYVDRVALVLTSADKMIAVGRYDTVEPGKAEVAFLVEDGHQGRGIGQLLLEHLAQAGRERGIERFIAEVLPDNQAMIHTFKDAGYRVAEPVRRRRDGARVQHRPHRHRDRRDGTARAPRRVARRSSGSSARGRSPSSAPAAARTPSARRWCATS